MDFTIQTNDPLARATRSEQEAEPCLSRLISPRINQIIVHELKSCRPSTEPINQSWTDVIGYVANHRVTDRGRVADGILNPDE